MRKGIAVALIVAFPLLLLAPPAALWWTAGRELDRVEEERRALLAQEKLPATFTPLLPDPLPDDASGPLEEAAIALGDPRPLRKLMAELYRQSMPRLFPAPDDLAAVWERTRPAVEPFRRALRCSRRDRQKSPDYAFFREMGAVLFCSAEFARQEGRHAEALTLLSLMLGLEQIDPACLGDLSSTNALSLWGAVLADHSLSAAEAEEFCVFLDRLESSRPPMMERVRLEWQYRRFEALENARPDQNGSLPDWPAPGARHLWTRRLAAFEALRINDVDLRELSRICDLPSHEQSWAVDGLENALPEAPLHLWRRGAVYKLPVTAMSVGSEQWTRTLIKMCRISTAIAWYQAERGRNPESLEDLVPRYVPRLDRSPSTGRAFGYKDGAFRSPSLDEGVDAVWPVKRR